ncbi:type II toxin-antitoxin system RelE/ParE family toxin [Leclercia sp.]|uniref:type II toxin-antitoxin system RelE/ParE family toxin n=1 Tax=Leclercia sp. TaxID=1898428 RepID=UPI002FDCBD4A
MKEIVQTEVFRRWQKSIKDDRVKTLIATRLFRLSQGLSGDVKPVGEGISELRIQYGPGYRLYYQQQGDILIILLCGGDKSSQKKDIEMAKMLARSLDYQEIIRNE